MKTFICTLFVLCMPWWASAQLFEKYENNDRVDVMVVTQNMFQLLSGVDIKSDDPDVQQFENLIKNLQGIRVLSTADAAIGKQMLADVNTYISQKGLQELMRVKEDGNHLKFYSEPGSAPGKISRLLMFMRGKEDGKPEYVVLSIKGDIDLNEVSQIAGVLHGIPGAKELKNVHSKSEEK